MVTMYMPLLNEGTDARRPVEVTPLYGGVYQVEGPMPADEEWEFAPGTVVDCKWKRFGDERRLIATGPAFESAKRRLSRWAIVVGLVIISLLPFTTDLNWIVAPSPYSSPYFALWALVSGAAYYHWRRVRFVKQTAGPLALLFCASAILALFA
jgi:hypothetical protein